MKISYIIPCYRSEKTISVVVDEILLTMKSHSEYEFEIILVNDSSPDDTFNIIKGLAVKHDNIIGVNLAKNFGQHAALMSGFSISTGDIVVCLDDDGQTPADESIKLINKIDEGYDVVYARYDEKKHSRFRNWGSNLNKHMTEALLGKPKELYVSSYFAARRFVVDEMLRYQNAYPYVIGLVLRTTNKICNVSVNHRDRIQGESGYSLKKLISLWVNGFTSFSVKPLRFATFCGSFLSMIGFIYAIWTIIKKIIYSNAPVGWSSTVSIILIMGGMILLVLGMIGEYIGRIYICINNSPQYVVREIVRKDNKE